MPYIDSEWKTWYQAQNSQRYQSLSGEAFEAYISSVLEQIHPDFINPDPMGSHGDGGCDGLADGGNILYACYGARAKTKVDEKSRDKINSDFTRALSQWDAFTIWTFITNTQVGPMGAKCFCELQQEHGAKSLRPIQMKLWKTPEKFWTEAISKLTFGQLDQAFPGVPHAQNVELNDLVELIDVLGVGAQDDTLATINPVPETKMDYNRIPEATRIEFNAGRLLAPRIDRWFQEQGNPELRDTKASAFHSIYLNARLGHDKPREMIESVYIAIGGSDFRTDSNRANAVYSLTSYFFDSCDIFEEPPSDYEGGGQEE